MKQALYKQNEIENNTVLYGNVLRDCTVGGNSRQSVAFPVTSMLQVLFRCPRPLNRGVLLIKVSFKVNKGNKFWDFGYCPLYTVPA